MVRKAAGLDKSSWAADLSFITAYKTAGIDEFRTQGSLGDTRYPGGKRSDLLRSIGEKIFSLPEDTVLYSGHSEKTTVGVEKRRYGM